MSEREEAGDKFAVMPPDPTVVSTILLLCIIEAMFLIRSKSDRCLALTVSHSVTDVVET